MDNRIALRYASALVSIGKEKGTMEALAKDLNMISDTIHGSDDLRAVMHSPVIRPDAKRKIMLEIFKSHLSADTMGFIDLLVKKGRPELLVSVASEFQRLLDVENKTINADITSARELDDDSKKQIVAKLELRTGLHVRARYVIDPAIRGGFVAKIGDTLIDASLQHQLEMLRKDFMSGAIAAQLN